ncbi:MAG: vitamin K epoxide reductase family protein [Candidatus Bipolaricaulota bacterium]|nr:vitamin K epoxide reductase family protein [Candidatus Bipolaricaulota bacterium]MDW8031273.1 vitamin K epoxide reductase family protein [Candidatus Bipolaricaulota bacterium]
MRLLSNFVLGIFDILFIEVPLPPPNEGFSRGFELAIAVLVGMILAVIYVVVQIVRVIQGAPVSSSSRWRARAFIALTVLGMAIAGYLTYVETQAGAAFCGPIGDCNIVQSSPYAKLFGVLPVGLLGLIGYIAILGVWLWGRRGWGRFSVYAPLLVLGMTLFGVLFSIYLTYLEPFVIGAVCIWCVSSAVIMTLLMLLSLRPALQVVREYSDAPQRISHD